MQPQASAVWRSAGARWQHVACARGQGSEAIGSCKVSKHRGASAYMQVAAFGAPRDRALLGAKTSLALRARHMALANSGMSVFVRLGEEASCDPTPAVIAWRYGALDTACGTLIVHRRACMTKDPSLRPQMYMFSCSTCWCQSEAAGTPNAPLHSPFPFPNPHPPFSC
eukprot:356036-Chlamydomonas_euryale.AAC.4